MTKERMIEAAISIGVGLLIALLSGILEVLKEVDFSSTGTVVNSAAGMLAYTLQRIKLT